MLSALDRPIPKQDWLKQAGKVNGLATAPCRLDFVPGKPGKIADAGPWEAAVLKLIEFQYLGDNWDGQGAQAPSREILGCAIGLAYVLHEKGMEPPSSVVPGPAGTVVFEWQGLDGSFAEVEIVRPFYAEVMVVEPGKPPHHWTLPAE